MVSRVKRYFLEIRDFSKLVDLNLYNNIEKEIIIIDDNSTDGSAKIIEKYESDYKFIKTYHKKENKGKGGFPKNCKTICDR